MGQGFSKLAPELIERGWHVFPVCWPKNGKCACPFHHTDKKEIGKAPIIRRGMNAASNDPAQIEAWAEEFPEANIGVNLEKSGLVVIDPDSDSAIWEVDKIGGPRTATVRTGNGQHRWYKRPEGCPLWRVIHWGESAQIDILSAGFAIHPGSVHATGRVYEWLITPEEVLAELPEVFVHVLQEHVQSKEIVDDPVVATKEPPMALSGAALEVWNGTKFVPGAKGEIDRSATLLLLARELLLSGADIEATTSAIAGWDQLHGKKFSGRKDKDKRYRETVQSASESAREVTGFNDPENDLPAVDKVTQADWRDLFARRFPHTKFGQGSFRRYSSGAWKKIETEVVGKELSVMMGRSVSARLLEDVIKLLKNWLYIDSELWNKDPNLLVLENCTLDVITRQVREWRPEDLITDKLDYSYDPSAKSPNWDRVLSLFDQDIQEFIQEFFGYCLTRQTKFDVSLWVIGPAGGGKSSFVAGIKTMLGPKVGHLSLRNLNQRFGLAEIPGKTVMVATEQPSVYMEASDLFNAIVSGETVHSEQKYEKGFDVVPVCKILWSMHEPPKINNPEDGMFRRTKIVEMPSIPEEDRDPAVREGIKSEGAGILNWALDGLERLMERGRFKIPEKVRIASNKFRDLSDIPGAFLSDMCERGPYLSGRQALYNAYREWCHLNGHQPKAKRFLVEDWKRLGLTLTANSGTWYWRGVKIVPREFEAEVIDDEAVRKMLEV
jgi:P4 family phage/plasmid primase-like protien